MAHYSGVLYCSISPQPVERRGARSLRGSRRPRTGGNGCAHTAGVVFQGTYGLVFSFLLVR